MEALCGLCFFLLECVINLDRTGQLGESREYQMGMVRMVCFHVWSSDSDSPHLCQLRAALVGPHCNKH
jgi:hypothetical protein